MFLVIGGELKSLDTTEFRDPNNVDFVGLFEYHSEALSAWRANASKTVDNAHMRYFIIPISLT
jgi:hypothetical protein